MKFLELIGVQLFPPSAPRAPTSRSGCRRPRPRRRHDPAGTRSRRVRTETDDAVVLHHDRGPGDHPVTARALVGSIGQRYHASTARRARPGEPGSCCFDKVPKPDDALLHRPARCRPVMRGDAPLRLRHRGRRRRPRGPTACSGRRGTAAAGWRCDLDRDDTGGLNRDGDVIVHVPTSHTASCS